jgi:sphingolipid delta-4 desaturase
MAQTDFIQSDEPQVHFQRRKEMLKKHPEVKALAGPNRLTPVFLLGLVAGQLALAVLASGFPWWGVLLLAYLVGAAISHALYVMIHECTHNLAAKSPWVNKVLAILCDVAIGFPGAIAFRKYHLLHHRFMGEPDLDADMAAPWEARLVGNSWWRKALWMGGFSLSQALRPLKMKGGKLIDAWSLLNLAVSVAADVALVVFVGPWALGYILLSTVFGLGLHPLGGRWIQEHYVTTPGQETYSYYGPANRLAFNVGYHNEHHDFMNVAWNNLPKLKAAAPEFYDSLASYRSWGGLMLRFIFDRELSPWSRIAHPPSQKSRA